MRSDPIGPALAFCLALACLQAGCPNDKLPEKPLYFPELRPPVGVSVEVIDDVNTNTPAGGSITVITVVEPGIDRGELDRLMQAFYRQASARRRGFRDGPARQIDLRFYDSKEKAAMRSDNWLARVELTPPDAEPTYSNRQRLPLLRWVKEALGDQPQYAGEVKPQLLADPEALAVEISLPFVKYDGSGDYVDEVTFARATTDFASTAIDLFEKIEQLKQLTLVGTHRGATLLRVVLTREQYRQVNLRQVEESLGEFRGKLINMKLAGKVDDRKMETMLAKRRRELYREVFELLPKENVEIARQLQGS